MTGELLPNKLQGVMKRAQNVAQAVVQSRSTLSSWSCMGARRRNVASSSNTKEEDMPETSLLSSERTRSKSPHSPKSEIVNRVCDTNNVKLNASRGVSGNDETDEDEELLSDSRVNNSASPMEEITEGELLYELEMELQRGENGANKKAQEEEEAAAAREITEEEVELAVAADTKPPTSTAEIAENLQFYPPGRIMHIISLVSSDASNACQDHSTEEHEHVGIYETNRELYSKLRLSRTMINDHYMPMYKKMIESLIRELENDEDCICTI